MARGYTVTTVGLALGASSKWVDNVLSHHSVPGVTQGTQGVARRISTVGVFYLALIHRLSEELQMPIQVALDGARILADQDFWHVGTGLSFRLDRETALHFLEGRLESAVEAAPLPRRGRPPRNAKRGA